jgi:4-alpha-glucanotransferase
MERKRASGILLHPTSLPGRYGIGELGDEARAFLGFLGASGQRLWQVLPLGPTGYGDSPYQSFSAFAGNPLLISTDRLVRDGLLTATDLDDLPDFPAARVDFGPVIGYKNTLLRRAFARFKANGGMGRVAAWHAPWLDDFALFMALKERHGGAVWSAWEPDIVHRDPAKLAAAREELAEDVDFYRFCQYRFFQDWGDLKREANAAGVRIIGDLPIFVAYDSADAWANQELFFLDPAGHPSVVAGVPPDYFSATGQLWGNPLYRWDAMARDDYAWWVARLRMSLTMFDLARIDHFRGFEAYWEIPAGEATAINGRWVKGPDAAFFASLRAQLGDLPIIAEDLGLITDEVRALREQFGLPGMLVLQFAPSDPDNAYLPHNHERNSVVYTGTHDNDTTRGWWAATSGAERAFVRRYLGHPVTRRTIAWEFIRLAFASVAATAIVPLQDALNLGSAGRMNTPGLAGGNWGWRYDAGALTPDLAARLRDLTELYARLGTAAHETPPASQ